MDKPHGNEAKGVKKKRKERITEEEERRRNMKRRGRGWGGGEVEQENQTGSTLRLVCKLVVLRKIIMLGKKINLFTRCQICISGLSPRPHGVLAES